ncbi:MarR family transcriptional regulator [Hymenobacter sp. 15J16-1T3B]|uniref:MarR family winged helix-turn-helix transcriptional regulator n=1 Tax=Hymenobacter sp. 15J16-1T3B TaxID=2886941 RepID=UPI001D12A4B5|nr:MarR family transcriptional regulator [Hymenobacter sp. 15J16-1T3B]MCC3158926.1 MarR family transcriptional regulator [Hymenobacter sp. 15J16-1T3B]
MDYSLLKQLIEQAEAFEQHQQASHSAPADLARFAAWLHTRTVLAPTATDPHPDEMHRSHETAEVQISKLVIFMNRYARVYSRLALADTPLLTIDDFAYLASLYRVQPLSKTELITRNVHEKASGTEVIKRLLANGLVAEQPHATDRRRKQLTVTDAGLAVLRQVVGRMTQAAQLVAGDLNAQERQQLLYLLQRLDKFHLPIFLAPRPASFEELMQLWQPLSAAEE